MPFNSSININKLKKILKNKMNNNKEIYLCSFASPDLYRSVKRFKNQAENMEFIKKLKFTDSMI